MADWPYSTARWRKLRAAKLAASPLCEVHGLRGKLVSATVVDHRVAIAAGGDPFPDLDGLMSMCASCHSTKTNARDNAHAFGSDRWRAAFKGCGLDGRPIDADHPFLQTTGGLEIAGPSDAESGARTHKISKLGFA
jgi:hypothetical protein